jgi:hypothetical protein
VLTAADLNTYCAHEGGAWSSWTPTWTNVSVGNGTVSALYARASRLITFKAKLTLGSTSSVSGEIRMSLPVVASTGFEFDNFVGRFVDADGSRHFALAQATSTNTVQLNMVNSVGGYIVEVVTSATQPFTWTNGDQILVSGVYEAAA